MKILFAVSVAILVSVGSGAAFADGIVSAVVSSPLSADGYVRDSRTGLNIYLQTDDAVGIEFMDPEVVGYGIPAGGRLEVELVSGFERDQSIPIAQPSIMLVGGAPQQGMPGKAVGYAVEEGANENTFAIVPSSDEGLVADNLTSPAPGAKGDPVRQRGVKVIHVGLKKAFINRGERGAVAVRILGSDGNVVQEGSAEIEFISEPRPQIFPTNFPHGRRNHNWQKVSAGAIVGQTSGTVPIALMLFDKNEPGGNKGIVGAGVLSTQQLKAMEYAIPEDLKRYTGGLIVQDTSGDGLADPNDDSIIGGVIGAAPAGAKGQELRSLMRDGVADLSRPTTAFAIGPGKAFGGAVMLLEFSAGDKPGLYRPTLALLNDPDDKTSGDSSRYTYSIVVE
jgi:hypothetical protein